MGAREGEGAMARRGRMQRGEERRGEAAGRGEHFGMIQPIFRLLSSGYRTHTGCRSLSYGGIPEIVESCRLESHGYIQPSMSRGFSSPPLPFPAACLGRVSLFSLRAMRSVLLALN